MCHVDRGLRRVAVASMATVTPTSETYAASLYRVSTCICLPAEGRGESRNPLRIKLHLARSRWR